MVNYLKMERMGIITIGISNLYDTWVIIVSWNGLFCSGMLILETNFRRYIWEIFVKNLGYFTAINNSAFTFTQYGMIAISELFIRKKGDIVRQKVLSCLAQLFSKYFAIDFLRSDTTWFRRRRFSSQYFLPNVRNLFRAILRL